MKVNKLLKVASVAVLASTLAACGKEKVSKKDYEKWAKDNGYVLEEGIDYEGWAEDNGYVEDPDYEGWAEDNGYVQPVVEKAKLEVTFNNFADNPATGTVEDPVDEQQRNLTEIDYDSLKAKFDGDYDFLLMLGNSTCGTCSTLKSVLADWIAETHYTVYYINDLTAGGNDAKTEVLGKLGNPTNWPRLYAVVGGEVEEVKFFANSAAVTRAAVDELVAKHYTLEEFKAEVYRFENMAELREAIVDGEQFILYVGRDACGDCKNLSDIHRDNTLTKIFKEYEGKFYTLVSEDTIAEYKDAANPNALWADTTKWSSYWGNINVSTQTSSVSDYNKAENLAYMVAGGAFDETTLALDRDAFLTAAVAYANDALLHDDGTKYMRDSIRSVPGFVAVNFAHSVDYATEADAIMTLISKNATLGTKVVGETTYKTVIEEKEVQVYEGGAWVNKTVTYERLTIKGASKTAINGSNKRALWVTHKNAFVGALGGKGDATFGTYTNNMTFNNINSDVLTSRSDVYYNEYELAYVQAQTMNWLTSWVYTPAA
ncbi:MAG: hypothetical protein E7184_02365 [Erysipelotrichaceae bacterium]|nr:hypothetical protein [Erysipelotrichaceae bacterium]